MPFADLHVHTDVSDGTLAVEEVPAAARAAGLDAVAVTDHDRVNPGFESPVVRKGGVVLVHGIELRVESPAGRVDLLGYGLDPTAALKAETERLQADRIERGAAIVEKVESRLGIDLDVEVTAGFGRPDVARAVVSHPDTAYETNGAVFEDLIHDGGPCYVPRTVPSFERGRALLSSACALVGLAHPLRYDDVDAALELARSLDAIERWYPYETAVDHAPVEELIEQASLVRTGGSDSHGERLGAAGVPEAAFEAVRTRLPDPA